ncbi:MAG: type II toxin-antitoxin system VapC family toxin [Bacteroidota bacterium]
MIDTNICIYYMKGMFGLNEKFKSLEVKQIYISEITLAELKFGVANSASVEKNQLVLEYFLTGVQILPIYNSLDLYASEKARLRQSGRPLDDFDLLIGVGAVHNEMTLVTNNPKHFRRITGIKVENWTEGK